MGMNLKAMKKLFVLSSIICLSGHLFAQPVNDDCIGALEITFASSEAEALLISGDTRGASGSANLNGLCSHVWYTDDVWFKFTTPDTLPEHNIVIRAYFNQAEVNTDVEAVGMALYEGCDSTSAPVSCFNSGESKENFFEISPDCLIPDYTYLVRLWSVGNSGYEGTFRMGVFGKKPRTPILWTETFDGGIESNGWFTSGMCARPDSNHNAGFRYLPDGVIDNGAFIFAGAAIASPSVCDGAVGVDSDYNDTYGLENSWGGPCPTPGEHILISPVIYSGGWNVSGLSASWHQALRQFQSTFTFSYRTTNAGEQWSDWTEMDINSEFPINSYFISSDVQRIFMPGAAGKDSLQIRFIYRDNYYMWALDDVHIVETECHNMNMTGFNAIAPWANLPHGQARRFAGLTGIQNVGSCPQSNVSVHLKVEERDNNTVFYNENLTFGTITTGSVAENKIFPTLVDIPQYTARYRQTYSILIDSIDFDSTDNVFSHDFETGGSEFALEDGFTRSVSVSRGIYNSGAPLSFAYGNIFRPETGATVSRVKWGVNNANDFEGNGVLVLLIEWNDNNDNMIAEAEERKFIGFGEYEFTGNEDHNIIVETSLEHFENPGDQIFIHPGKNYMVMIEYKALSADDPQLFLLASEERDYTAQVVAMDSAYEQGLIDHRLFMTALGFSPDGVIDNIDYEVRELNVTDNRVYFGDHIVPLVRLLVDQVGTIDQLGSNNIIKVVPNPASDFVTVYVEFEKAYSDISIRILNTLSQVVFEKGISLISEHHAEEIDLRHFPPGAYLVQVETEEGQRVVKLTVVR